MTRPQPLAPRAGQRRGSERWSSDYARRLRLLHLPLPVHPLLPHRLALLPLVAHRLSLALLPLVLLPLVQQPLLPVDRLPHRLLLCRLSRHRCMRGQR